LVERVSEGKLVAEERYKHFHDENKKVTLELREAQAKRANYLHQLSFTLRVRDAE
jgi:hypothetical protein